jgi:hypothetical protein
VEPKVVHHNAFTPYFIQAVNNFLPFRNERSSRRRPTYGGKEFMGNYVGKPYTGVNFLLGADAGRRIVLK